MKQQMTLSRRGFVQMGAVAGASLALRRVAASQESPLDVVRAGAVPMSEKEGL